MPSKNILPGVENQPSRIRPVSPNQFDNFNQMPRPGIHNREDPGSAPYPQNHVAQYTGEFNRFSDKVFALGPETKVGASLLNLPLKDRNANIVLIQFVIAIVFSND